MYVSAVNVCSSKQNKVSVSKNNCASNQLNSSYLANSNRGDQVEFRGFFSTLGIIIARGLKTLANSHELEETGRVINMTKKAETKIKNGDSFLADGLKSLANSHEVEETGKVSEYKSSRKAAHNYESSSSESDSGFESPVIDSMPYFP